MLQDRNRTNGRPKSLIGAHGRRGEAADDPKSVGLTMLRKLLAGPGTRPPKTGQHGKTLEKSTSRSGMQMAEKEEACWI